MRKYNETAIIIGAGPGGLTAAYELLERTHISPLILEKSLEIGGISRTVNYKGNRLDIGGHRFFSKSQRVMDWWQLFLPVMDEPPQRLADLDYHKKSIPDKIMLVRKRLSRIFYLRRFFDYPVTFNFNTFRNLGITRVIKIGFSYLRIRLSPIKHERNLEDFFINRFGKELYETFFKDYTEKVWGIPCTLIEPEWGAQRIKGLSISKAIFHAMKSVITDKTSISQKGIETSLINKFFYPKFGPGQLWEEVAEKVIQKGGTILKNSNVVRIEWLKDDLVEVSVIAVPGGEITKYRANYLFSTMPVKELIKSMEDVVPENIRRIADGLPYRDFITVGLLVKKLKINQSISGRKINRKISDNWIYIQEKDVMIGRLQIFNNWSPYMVADENNTWLGLEYFCNEGDVLWNKGDDEFVCFAIAELVKIGIICEEDVLDTTIIRVPKAYPAYFGTYQEMGTLISFTNSFKNMFMIGRNGMHKYNNQDHSMLTAMVAVDHILSKNQDKSIIWNINTEKDYHEMAIKNVPS
ncbi:UDP-galactopyranose mutase [Pedobacter suwonensis]|uniref:UDP-galactopyranose mutase n=1 Tax=Pedobacter suwonensis TaxID=332999 RepID=A0A1I0SP80_9SPHI|nr:NAD(P)/FAD-dependent oxidoreductase [Pedobacter suwonensis]SFA41217.1 UDP-galactopyranose mutase [Pedobacter suwonensis]